MATNSHYPEKQMIHRNSQNHADYPLLTVELWISLVFSNIKISKSASKSLLLLTQANPPTPDI